MRPCGATRPRSGVSIPRTHASCTWNERWMRPWQGDMGGHTGTAPTHLHQTTWCAITPSHCTFDSPRQPHGVSIPHPIAHSIAPNRTVYHNPIGVVLSIAQGWQVQRSIPWVMMQARRLHPWGLYFFSSHIIITQCRMDYSRMVSSYED